MNKNNYLTIFSISLCIPIIICKHMNVLLLILDDLRPAIGCYGDKNAYTPHIDRLAFDSVIFKNAFAQQALCAPSRNSFLTSRRPDTLHLYDFYSYWRDVAGNSTTLPQFFKENGYRTMSIGKVFHPGISSNYSDDEPYSWSSTPFHPPSEKYKEAKVCLTKRNPFPQRNLVCPVSLSMQPDQTLPDIESTHRAVQFIRSARTFHQPFFLAVGFHKPHIPLKYPQSYKKFHPLYKVVLPKMRRKPMGLPDVAWNPWTDIRERQDVMELNISFPFGVLEDKQAKLIIQSYYSSVSYVDDLIGKLIITLASTKQDKNTVVVLIGDHGWSLGEHGEWSKYSNFDIATRIPFILKVPSLTHKNKKLSSDGYQFVSDPVELVDLFPTLVESTGFDAIQKCNASKTLLCTEGKSLMPLIQITCQSRNSELNKTSELVALSQYPRPGQNPTAHPNSDKPRLKDIRIMGCSIRSNKFRYTEWLGFRNLSIIWSDLRAAELYNHDVDPDENVNLIENEDYCLIKNKLSNQLRNIWQIEKVYTG